MTDRPDPRPRVGEQASHRGPVLVIGGGIAGLAAAYEVTRLGGRALVLEAGGRPGGVILTERVDGFLIDAGPDAILAQRPAALDLCRELGLGHRLTPTLLPRTAYILRSGRLHPLPEASVLGIPARLAPLAATGLFSTAGKARMALDLVLPRRRANGVDESIGAFMRRRFGDEVVRYLAQPLLAGIHSGDVDRLSMRALFPRLVEAEARHRSLIRAFRTMHGGSSKDGLFRSLPGGIGELVDALVAALPSDAIRLSSPVRHIDRLPDGGYRVALASGDEIDGPAVVVSTPTYVAAEMLRRLDARLAALCAEVPYASSVTVALGYRRSAVSHGLEGSGFLVPKAERAERLMAASWVSSKWPGRAPEGFVLLRAFLGGARDPELMAWNDDDLVALAHRELSRLLGIAGSPSLARLYRWERANAQHEVGHLARLDGIEQCLARWPGLHVTGSGFRGTGLTDCVGDARRVATAVARHLGILV